MKSIIHSKKHSLHITTRTAIFVICAISISVSTLTAQTFTPYDLNNKSSLDRSVYDVNQKDGYYMRTQYTVSVHSESGVFKGTYTVYLHKNQKYIKFKNTWINIQGKLYFTYGGVRYFIK